jgi:protein subunit release factor B
MKNTNQQTEVPLFSITKNDFEVVFYRSGVGAGGQKLNKTSSACRITHRPSGAVGDSKTHRSQIQNKREAFHRLVASKEFQSWLRIEAGVRLEGYRNIEEKINEELQSDKVKIEIFKDGKWQTNK